MCLLVFPVQMHAGGEFKVYTFGNVLVFDAEAKGFFVGGRCFNVIPLDDKADLKISTIAYFGTDAAVYAYENFNNFLIVLLWKNVLVLDLSDLQQPKLVKNYELIEHARRPGQGTIIQKGNKFKILGARVSAELTAYDDIDKWGLVEIDGAKEPNCMRSANPAGVLAQSGQRSRAIRSLFSANPVSPDSACLG